MEREILAMEKETPVNQTERNANGNSNGREKKRTHDMMGKEHWWHEKEKKMWILTDFVT